MSQGTNVQTLLGATLSISATLPATYDSAGYTATAIAWTAIGQVEDFGEHGGSANVAKFTPVDTGVVAKSKGSKDYGKLPLILGSVPGDAGQILLGTGFEATAHYSVKLVYPKRDGETTAEVHYLDCLVTSHSFKDGKVDDISRVAVDLEVCRKPVVVVAT